MRAQETYELQLSALNQRMLELKEGLSVGFWGFERELKRVEWQIQEIDAILAWYRGTVAKILELAGDERPGFTLKFDEDGIPKRTEERQSARSVLRKMEVHTDLGFRLEASVKELLRLGLLTQEDAATIDLAPPKHAKLEEERAREHKEYQDTLASRDALLEAARAHAGKRGDLPEQSFRDALNCWNSGRYRLVPDDIPKFAGELAKEGLLPPFYRTLRSLTEVARKLGLVDG